MQLDYNLFLHGPIPSTAMQGYYNLNLVALSYLAAFLGSYVTLDLTGRILEESSKRSKQFWILTCSVIMGFSIWCMHFIGMLAYIMPMAMSYDPFWTLLSLLVALIGSLAAFSFIQSGSISLFKMIISGIFMGLCIASMHYIGMEAMESERMPIIRYIPWIFFSSIGIAIVISIAAIWLLLQSNQGSINRQFQLKTISALVMAGAICSMHYTGMAAAVFIPHPNFNVNIHSAIYSTDIAYYIAVILSLICFTSLITSTRRQITINYIQKNQANIIQTELEKKIEDRTVELKIKNQELSNAFDQLKKIQENLVYTEKMNTIGQLSAGIAHEINNPLSYILSNVSFFQKYYIVFVKLFDLYTLLLNELQENSSYNKTILYKQVSTFIRDNKITQIIRDLDGILTESKEGLLRIKSIIENLNSLTGTISEINNIDVNTAINDSIDIAWNELKYKCNIIKNLSDLPIINGSLRQLELMIVNLLLNASQSIEKKGDIKIISSVQDSVILISITDTGYGISPENIPKLFTPFFTTKPIGTATGLGLASVYGIVKSFGGKIEVESKLGKGSTFTVYLPIKKNG